MRKKVKNMKIRQKFRFYLNEAKALSVPDRKTFPKLLLQSAAAAMAASLVLMGIAAAGSAVMGLIF